MIHSSCVDAVANSSNIATTIVDSFDTPFITVIAEDNMEQMRFRQVTKELISSKV